MSGAMTPATPGAAAGEGGPAGGPRETADGCRERAAADLVASAAMITANQRVRLETSAASWTSRAAILQRVEDGAERRAHATAATLETRR